MLPHPPTWSTLRWITCGNVLNPSTTQTRQLYLRHREVFYHSYITDRERMWMVTIILGHMHPILIWLYVRLSFSGELKGCTQFFKSQFLPKIPLYDRFLSCTLRWPLWLDRYVSLFQITLVWNDAKLERHMTRKSKQCRYSTSCAKAPFALRTKSYARWRSCRLCIIQKCCTSSFSIPLLGFSYFNQDTMLDMCASIVPQIVFVTIQYWKGKFPLHLERKISE